MFYIVFLFGQIAALLTQGLPCERHAIRYINAQITINMSENDTVPMESKSMFMKAFINNLH